MKSLIAQFKQQSSGLIQLGTSYSNNNNKDSTKTVDKENPDVNSRERTEGHNDDDVSIHA